MSALVIAISGLLTPNVAEKLRGSYEVARAHSARQRYAPEGYVPRPVIGGADPLSNDARGAMMRAWRSDAESPLRGHAARLAQVLGPSHLLSGPV